MPTIINLKKAKTWLIKKSLYEFVLEMWDSYDTSPFSDCWLIEYLCECYQYSIRHFLPRYVWQEWVDDKTYENIRRECGGGCAVRDFLLPNGEHTHNHDLNIAPRHTKSSIMNVLGPAWTIINTPITVASVSHSLGLSGEMIEKKQKLFTSDKYKYYFGEDLSVKPVKNSATHIQLMNGGRTYSVAMDRFTGFGADCFCAGTRVLTDKGYVNIENLKEGDTVVSYNLREGRYEYSKVTARRTIENRETGIITTGSGRKAECTPDHRFWVEDRGYQKVCDIEKGSRLKVCSLQDMRENDLRLERILQNLLREFDESPDLYSLLSLWRSCEEQFARLDKVPSERKDILLKEVPFGSKQLGKESECNFAHLSSMWKRWSSKYSDILLSGMQEKGRSETAGNSEQNNRCLLQELWEIVFSACELNQDVLLSGLRESDAFKDNAGREQSKLQRSVRGISERILGNESSSFGEGRILLSVLSYAIEEYSLSQERKGILEAKFDGAPQRQGYTKQLFREFSNSLRGLSYKDTQDWVRVWEPTGERKTVYDIQVEPNNNFFANGILVHNCIINDDLISVAQARQNGAVLLHARDYFKTTMPSRLNNKTTGVIWHIMQRIGRGDISDLIAEDKGLRKIYSHTEIQAVADKKQVFVFPCSGKVKEVNVGDVLWAERFGDYTNLRMELGSEDFNTQYNQEPSESRLNVIKDNMIHWMDDDKEVQEFVDLSEFHYNSHDCPVKDKETSDFHGYGEGYTRANELLITDATESHMGYVEEKDFLAKLQAIDPASIQIIEDKANGAALAQDLKKDIPGIVTFDPGTRSKTQRLELASTYMEKGLVRFARNDHTEYLVQQLKKFPLLEHDDIVDAFSQMVIYHFTQRQLGVYTGAFSYQNVVDPKEVVVSKFLTYGATINGDLIKVLAVQQDNYTDTYTVVEERMFRSLQAFEEFCRKDVLPGNLIIDCSPQNRLRSLLTDVYNVIKFEDSDRDKSISILKTGFYKRKVLVLKSCKQTVNDIARLRVTGQSRERGVDQTETLDEGFAGCLRCLVTNIKGYSQQWY